MLAITISCAGQGRTGPGSARECPAARLRAPSRVPLAQRDPGSGPGDVLSAAQPPHSRAVAIGTLLALWIGLYALNLSAQSPATEVNARVVYRESRTAFARAQTNAVAAWTLGRAAFDLAEFIQDNQERNDVANTGVDACRLAIGLDPGGAPGHYYLALNLGQVVRSKKLAALRLLHEMEQEFLSAKELDPKLDFSGPDRSVGLLYLEAPSWSLGNRGKARTHLMEAVQRNPEYPENHLCLAEAYARWGEAQNLEVALKKVAAVLDNPKPPFNAKSWLHIREEWASRSKKLEILRDHLSANPRISPAERGARGIK